MLRRRAVRTLWQRNDWKIFAVIEDNLPEKTVAEKPCRAPECCAPAAR
jgi:hypothetical protein